MINKVEIEDLYNSYLNDIDEDASEPKLDVIKNLINDKDWDMEVDNIPNTTLMILYEYSTSMEKITDGKVSYKDVIQKLSSIMGKFRLGDWKEENGDNNLKYDGLSVTSEKYITTIGKGFGAQTVGYIDDDNQYKMGIVLYDGEKRNGIDFNNINDIRHTAFHEFNHIMEMCKTSETEETQVEISGRVFKNNEKLANGEVWGTGISTREVGEDADKYNNGNIIMHNQITEGAVELIARKLMEEVLKRDPSLDGKNLEDVIDVSRYSKHVNAIQIVMDTLGQSDVISRFITNSQSLIQQLESIKIDDNDALHFMNDYINDQQYFGIIPQYSPRTQLFRTMSGYLCELYGVDKDKLSSLKHEWTRAENDENIIEVLPELLSRYGDKQDFTDDEQEIFAQYLDKYRELIEEEKDFNENLQKGLENAQEISEEQKNRKSILENIGIEKPSEESMYLQQEARRQVDNDIFIDVSTKDISDD